MRAFFFTLSLAAAFFCCVSVSSAAMTRQDIIDLHERSLENLRKGDSAQAYEGYLHLLREEPGNPDIDFMLGQAAFAQSNYPMAVLAYIRVIRANPWHERARLELARTYAHMGQVEMASNELRSLRAINPALPSADEMEKVILGGTLYSPWTVSGRVGTGVFYDSNANMGTAISEYLGFILTEGEKKSSSGVYFSGELDMAYQMGQGSNWYLVSDIAFTNRYYFNSDVDSQLTWGRGALGLRWAAEKALAEIRWKEEFLDRESGFITLNSGAEATFVYALTKDWTLVTQGAYEYRDYASDYEGRRGTHGRVGEYIRYQFGESRHELLFGGSYSVENADEKRYDGHGFEVLGRVLFNLPYKIKAGFIAAWHNTRYDAPPTDLGGDNRWEKQFKAGIDLEKGVTENLSVNAQAQYTHNTSNHSIYQYDQWLFTMGLTYKF